MTTILFGLFLFFPLGFTLGGIVAVLLLKPWLKDEPEMEDDRLLLEPWFKDAPIAMKEDRDA